MRFLPGPPFDKTFVKPLSQTGKSCGTMGWKAPELLTDKDVKFCSSKMDIFSLGCIFYFILTSGRHPFQHEKGSLKEDINAKILEGNPDVRLKEPILKQLVGLMIKHEPECRIDIEGVHKHPALSSHKDNLEYLKKIFEQVDSNRFSKHLPAQLDWELDHLDWREKLSPAVRNSTGESGFKRGARKVSFYF